ncbi:MAG: TIGR03960 family B12-binding radical SAM protein [Candidatus Omnitrophota bacterium]
MSAINDILSGIMKPGRYIGSEWNVSRKDFASAGVKFAICFPDLYEVGMSNLGIRILYAILNNIPDVACERLFSPGIDLESSLRSNKREIFSLESRRGLKEFDIAGFSLGNELGYTNILAILDLAGIPFSSRERGSGYPLIIGGGPCTLNPEPLHDFFDLFIIGEAEEAIVELVNAFRPLKDGFKNGSIGKKELLAKLASIEGVYVPSLYDVECGPQPPVKIKKRIISDLDSAYFPVNWLVPFIQIVHDRISIELMRGCHNKCRFCQARQQYYPCRVRSPEKILAAAKEAFRRSGYEEIALTGLSVSDYPHIEKVLSSFMDEFKEKCVALSLPSIKPNKEVGGMSTLIASFKKTGLTFAPEAATEKMRAVLGKDFNMQEFMQAIEEAFASGYLHVKLYFMIGLPFETEADLDGIIGLAETISGLGKKIRRRPAQVNVAVNALIPKPHTCFQWFSMPLPSEIEAKQKYLRQKASRHKWLKLNFHDCRMSFLEAVFSRGDRRLSRVILNAYNAGARFDAWQEHFKFEVWQAAFNDCGIDPEVYLKEKPVDSILPWDFLEAGPGKDALLTEFNKIIDIK